MVAVTESSGMAALQSQAHPHHQPEESLNRSVHFDPEQLQVSIPRRLLQGWQSLPLKRSFAGRDQ